MNIWINFLAVLIFAASAGASEPHASGKQIRAAAQMAKSLEMAWNKADADAWGKLYTPNAEFLNISGLLFVGQDQITSRHAFIFSTDFKGTHLSARVRRVIPLGSDHMLVSTVLEVRGFQAPPPGITPTEPGVLRSIISLTLNCRPDTDCRIVYSQNTLIAPGVPTPN